MLHRSGAGVDDLAHPQRDGEIRDTAARNIDPEGCAGPLPGRRFRFERRCQAPSNAVPPIVGKAERVSIPLRGLLCAPRGCEQAADLEDVLERRRKIDTDAERDVVGIVIADLDAVAEFALGAVERASPADREASLADRSTVLQ